MKIREATFADQMCISKLQEENGVTSDCLETWKHIWMDNPVFKSALYPIGWVVECDKRIVGYVGNVVHEYEYYNRIIIVACARGLAVDQSYKGATLLLITKYLNQKNVELIINSSSNDVAYNLFSRLGCVTLDTPIFSKSRLWIALPYKSWICYLKSKLAKSKLTYIPHYVLFHIIANFQHFLMMIRSVYNSIVYDSQIQIKIKTSFSDIDFTQYNNLSNYVLRNYHIKIRRSTSFYRWFLSRSDNSLIVFEVSDPNNLLGFCIYRRYTDGLSRSEKLVLIDCIIDDKYQGYVNDVNYKALQYAKKHSIPLLMAPSCRSDVSDNLDLTFPIKTNQFPTPFTYKIKSEMLMSISDNSINDWYVTRIDGDSAL